LEENAGVFDVASFEIAKYPVTYRQYRAFLDSADGYANPDWWYGLRHEPQPGEQYRLFGNCPADRVSWYDAVAFCRWLSARLGYEVHLPTELEWQQAATGSNPENVYPWGREWESGPANTSESKLGRITAVGIYPAGASKQRVMDLVGNVWEWCLNKRDHPKDIDLSGDDRRVTRGGSWDYVRNHARAAFRLDLRPHHRGSRGSRGFRVARCSPI
jgi:formylglycine-generating enzyme required for sulfatase activity